MNRDEIEKQLIQADWCLDNLEEYSAAWWVLTDLITKAQELTEK